MVGNQEGSSEGPVWYLQQDVQVALLWNQVALLWNQLNAVSSQLAQSNQQLCLQQNLVLGLQQQLFHRCLQRDADQNLISKLAAKLFESESRAGPAENQKEDWDTESLGSPGDTEGSFVDVDADWIFVCDVSEVATEGAPPIAHAGTARSSEAVSDMRSTGSGSAGGDSPVSKAPVSTECVPLGDASGYEAGDESPASEDAPDEGRQCGGDRQEPIALEGAPPTPALRLRLPICQDPVGDQSCDAPDGFAPATTPLGTAQCQETPSDEPPKNRPSLPSTAADDSDQGIEDESSASEEAHDEGQQGAGDRQALTRDADANVSIGELLITAVESAPNLLPYLSVQELLNWRLLSRCTSNHEALIAHVAEMGSLRRPETLVAFMEQRAEIRGNPDAPFAAAFGGDAEQQKVHECLRWCAALAYESESKTPFGESHIHRIVSRNLRCLLLHSRSAEAPVADAANVLLWKCAEAGLPFVRADVAEATLGRLAEIFSLSGHSDERRWCIHRLVKSFQSLSEQQCQQLMSLLVRILIENPDAGRQTVLWGLQKLWESDDDPRRTYPTAYRMLRAIAQTEDPELQRGLEFLQYFRPPAGTELGARHYRQLRKWKWYQQQWGDRR